MKEKNGHILQKAIEHLPKFSMGNTDVWAGIEQELNHRSVSKPDSPFLKLSGYRAPKGLWEKLEARMDKQSPVLYTAIEELPVFATPDNSWNGIEAALSKSRTVRPKKVSSILIRVSIAATIVFAIGLTVLVYSGRREPNFPVNWQINVNKGLQPGENAGIESIYNEALCRSNPQVCQTELFKNLDEQRDEIESEIETMKAMIHNKDPQLMKYYHRLVNEQVEIEKRMVKLILES